MIRAALIFVGMLIGLALAAVTQGTMKQLRIVAPVTLPEWTAHITPTSTLFHGRATDPVTQATLDWDFQTFSLVGLHYRVDLTRSGLALQGKAALVWNMHTAQFSQMRGTLDLAEFYPTQGLTGAVSFADLNTNIDLQTRRLSALSGQGRGQNILLDGVALGAGDLRLSSDQSGFWQGEIALVPPGVALEILAQGTFAKSEISATGDILDGPDLPDSWQRWMNANLLKTPKGWRIDQSIDLRDPKLGP